MIDRRRVVALLAGFAATPALAQTGMSRMTAYAFSFAALKGGDIKLADYAGKPILVVNTASQCGYTPQYAGLQDLWNFHKYLIGRDGRIKASFPSAVAPNDARIVVAIEKELAE